MIYQLTKHQHTNAIVIKEMVIMTMSLDLQKTVFKRPQRLGEPQLGPQKTILKKGGVLPNSNYDPSPRSFYGEKLSKNNHIILKLISVE